MSCSTGCGCKSAGCGFLNVYDWLSDMLPPGHIEANNIYEVSFKTTRKGFYQNVNALNLTTGDNVIVESDRGYDLGRITMGGELVKLNMKKKKINPEHTLKIYRIATTEDIQKLEELRSKEDAMLVHTRSIIRILNLEMKLSTVEFQADGSKAIFYYTAEHRVDFRELIRILAQEFKIRVEMRQIGLRQESGLLGGVGSCGRELCCSSWLTDFKSVTTTAARYQNISLNPSKITGLCGRLKCCLNYELETYLDALKNIPDVKEIHTELGIAYLQKTDIFKNIMWFSYGGDSNWVAIKTNTVAEIHEKYKRYSELPPSLAALEDSEIINKDKSKDDFETIAPIIDTYTPLEKTFEATSKSQGEKSKATSLQPQTSSVEKPTKEPRKPNKKKKTSKNKPR
jgi:cell fate regulator YaaT (PSP1 superfamily)